MTTSPSGGSVAWFKPAFPAAASFGVLACGSALALTAVVEDNGPVLCPFRAVTGGYCPGCGLSRAFGSLVRGDVAASLSYHPYLPFLLVQVAIIGAVIMFGSVSTRHWVWNQTLPLTLANGGLLLALWIGRLASGAIPSPFGS